MRIARIAGIDIGIHYTWFIIFVLITWSLAAGYFPVEYPGWGDLLYWLTAALAAFLLFVSVLIHELAHSLVARSRGVPVRSITLFLLGGISNLESEPEKPAVEFAIAIVGPLTSVALAGISGRWVSLAWRRPGRSGPRLTTWWRSIFCWRPSTYCQASRWMVAVFCARSSGAPPMI